VLALKKINSRLASDPSIGREKQIGHTFLLGLQDNPGKFVKVWKQEILPLLEEYYFERPDVITEMFNDEIFEKEDGIKNFDEDVLSKALGNYTELIPPEPEAEPEPE
jgi:5-methylcytosine-specific restriction protein B